jgi:hypothetical protein
MKWSMDHVAHLVVGDWGNATVVCRLLCNLHCFHGFAKKAGVIYMTVLFAVKEFSVAGMMGVSASQFLHCRHDCHASKGRFHHCRDDVVVVVSVEVHVTGHMLHVQMLSRGTLC